LVLVLSAACEGNQSMFNPQGPAARSIAGFGWLLIGITLVVYVAVLIALTWALVRRRQADDDHPATASRLTLAVASAVAVTAATLVTLTISSEAVGRSLTTPTGPGRRRPSMVVGLPVSRRVAAGFRDQPQRAAHPGRDERRAQGAVARRDS
jgi:heme/copper-type cytochrome/quinol oxidase subunit 2